MPYRICKIYEVESGHMLSKNPGLCRFPHGHTRKVEMVLEADTLDENQMVCDFCLLKQVARECLEKYDHAMCLNSNDPNFQNFSSAYGERVIAFENQDPTTEVIVKAIFDAATAVLLKNGLRFQVRLVRVRLWETSSSWAEYEA